MRTRLAFNIALILSLLYLPWWAGAVIALSACFMIGRFYEVVIYGILADTLYGSRFGWHGFSYVATLYAVVIFAAASVIRKRLAW